MAISSAMEFDCWFRGNNALCTICREERQKPINSRAWVHDLGFEQLCGNTVHSPKNRCWLPWTSASTIRPEYSPFAPPPQRRLEHLQFSKEKKKEIKQKQSQQTVNTKFSQETIPARSKLAVDIISIIKFSLSESCIECKIAFCSRSKEALN